MKVKTIVELPTEAGYYSKATFRWLSEKQYLYFII